MESKKILHNVFQNIEVGIGEVSKVVGVSQRQLRYWEKKGYIEPISDDNSGVRRYNLSTLYLIVFIRLLFIPACIYFILKGIVNDKLLLSIPVILTSMPIATNAAIMANKYKANESFASQLVFLSALLSIITIPFISFLFIR